MPSVVHGLLLRSVATCALSHQSGLVAFVGNCRGNVSGILCTNYVLLSKLRVSHDRPKYIVAQFF